MTDAELQAFVLAGVRARRTARVSRMLLAVLMPVFVAGAVLDFTGDGMPAWVPLLALVGVVLAFRAACRTVSADYPRWFMSEESLRSTVARNGVPGVLMLGLAYLTADGFRLWAVAARRLVTRGRA